MILRKFNNSITIDDVYIGDIFKRLDFINQGLRQFSIVRKHLAFQAGFQHLVQLGYFLD